jgi:nucleotide-binding universal stress UspA family protein
VITITNSKILVPLDFSRCSEYALEYAKAIVKPLNGSLHLLHVVEPPAASIEWGYAFEQEAIAHSQKIAATYMSGAAELLKQEGLSATTEIISGTPFYAIAQFAEEQQMDLIVMSTHGRRGVERFLVGSTTERVLRLAHCPVLSVHPPKEFLQSANT